MESRRAPIIAVAQRLGLELFRRGREQRIRCLNHQHDDNYDAHPSCTLFDRWSSFKCWSCGNKGDVITLVAQANDCSLLDAARWLVVQFNLMPLDRPRPRQKRSRPVFVNRAEISGNAGSEATVRQTGSGPVASFSVATSTRWTDKKTGQKHEVTEWHRIVAWGFLAEVAQRIEKGMRVQVEGRLQTRKWTDDQGVKRQTTEVVAQQLILSRPLEKQEQPEPEGDELEGAPAEPF